MAAGRTARDGVAGFPRRYLAALRTRVKAAAGPGRGAAGRLGQCARELGIGTLALARIHDAALAALSPPGPDGVRARGRLAVRADAFFAEALAPAGELATVHGRLVRETDRRKITQEALATTEGELLAALERSRGMEGELRQLSRSLLVSREEERRRISRELHDALGQTLTAVNFGLASMKEEAAVDPVEFRASVARTQRLVQKSMRTVHRFARDLRPALLDDLGLVPALHAFAKEFGRRHGVRVAVSAAEESAGLDSDRRTALFRVAQEALVNVGRHARARTVRIALRGIAGGVRLEVWNDGAPFDVERALASRTNRHLGLLCMRERMEMVGGTFSVRSSKGKGTTVTAAVALPEAAGG